MEKETIKIEDTASYKVAITFKPFINPKCTEHMEIVKDMAKAINSVIAHEKDQLRARVRQTLSSFDYTVLSDFQTKCVMLLENEISK